MSILDPREYPERRHDERVARAEHAKRLLNDDLLQEAFDSAEQRVLRAWIRADVLEERERAHATVVALGILRQELQIIVNDGEHANAQRR